MKKQETTETTEVVLSPLNARIPKALHKGVKTYCAMNDRKIGDVVAEALTGFLAAANAPKKAARK